MGGRDDRPNRLEGQSRLIKAQAVSFAQLKALIDIFPVDEIAVLLDVVYNHAGVSLDDNSIDFFSPLARLDGGEQNEDNLQME